MWAWFVIVLSAGVVALAYAALVVVARLGGRLANPRGALGAVVLVGGAAAVIFAITLVTAV